MNDGRLAEYLVAADLERSGYPCVLISGREYDLVAETADGVVTVQVKSCLSISNDLIPGRPGKLPYKWRGYKFMARAASGGFGSYSLIDYFAFVALDVEKIIYWPAKSVTDSAMQRIPEKKFLKFAGLSNIGVPRNEPNTMHTPEESYGGDDAESRQLGNLSNRVQELDLFT